MSDLRFGKERLLQRLPPTSLGQNHITWTLLASKQRGGILGGKNGVRLCDNQFRTPYTVGLFPSCLSSKTTQPPGFGPSSPETVLQGGHYSFTDLGIVDSSLNSHSRHQQLPRSHKNFGICYMVSIDLGELTFQECR